jgi:PPOX class probable F420-dependent enzyme
MRLPEPAIELLRSNVLAHVATVNRDGSPQVTLVWVDVEDGDLVFNTAFGRQKVRNLERDPRIAVSVQHPERPRQYIAIHGTGMLVTEGASALIDRLAQKYTGQPYRRRQGEERVTVRVVAERLIGMGPWMSEA